MNDTPTLYLDFHGRFIDALGIQMYQKPTAAIAELIANAWDADAKSVDITLPTQLGPGAEIVVADTGIGMTLKECQEHYLKVGRNRRHGGSETTPAGRPVLGRKGIGKFAGFGIEPRTSRLPVAEALPVPGCAKFSPRCACQNQALSVWARSRTWLTPFCSSHRRLPS